jgi:hypothetical protein
MKGFAKLDPSGCMVIFIQSRSDAWYRREARRNSRLDSRRNKHRFMGQLPINDGWSDHQRGRRDIKLPAFL